MMFQFLLATACTSAGQTEPPLVDRPEPSAEEPSVPEPVEVVDPNDEPHVPPIVLGDYETLFNPTLLQEIRLTVPVASIDALNLDGSIFVPARFEHEGNALEIGLRLKGSSTYQDFDRKPAFRLKFDNVVANQEYASLTRLALNNLTGDPAQGREVVSYLAWAAGGMPVPRGSLARVYVNDEYFGLYAVVEAMDKAWLKRQFADPSGDLWAANNNADLTPEGIANFQLNHGEGMGPVTLAQAAAALADHSSDFATQASVVMDFDQFLDFWAWSVATGGQDGYPSHLNDYFLYADPGRSGRLVFSPWGQDEAWNDLWAFDFHGGIMAYKCGPDERCVAQLRQHIDAALTMLDEIDLAGAADALFSLSLDAVSEDGRSPYTPAEVYAARSALVERIARWPDTVRLEMGL